MRILGIDPGLATVGFGLIEYIEGEAGEVHFGHISTPSTQPMPERLRCIYREVKKLVSRFAPDIVVVEEIFFSKNRKTAIQVAQARGVAILAMADRGVALFEYTPMQIKQAVVGYGNASKRQVQQMVKALLKLKTVPTPNHAADALAAAICHAQSLGPIRSLEASQSAGRSAPQSTQTDFRTSKTGEKRT